MSEKALVHFTRAREALQKAKSIDEVKAVMDMAKRLKMYLKQEKESLTMQNQAAAIRLRAEKRAGEMLKEGKKNGDRAGKGRPKKPDTMSGFTPAPILEEIGITEKQATRWQAIASIPEEKFDEFIEAVTNAEEELTQTQALRFASIKDEQQQDAVIERIANGEAKNVTEASRLFKAAAANDQRLEAASTISMPDSIIVGDFWENADKVKDGSLSLIFTDPPYSKEAEADFPRLAEFASNKLARGGSILFYLGHLQLPAAFKAFEGKLRHWWTCACVHAGNTSVMNFYGVRVGWKPMLWFVKETRFDIQNIVKDTVSGATEKEHHEWQQAETEAQYWIEQLCPADGIVCDPFLGSGTTAMAAQKLNRQWIGFEKKPETALQASERLERSSDPKV